MPKPRNLRLCDFCQIFDDIDSLGYIGDIGSIGNHLYDESDEDEDDNDEHYNDENYNDESDEDESDEIKNYNDENDYDESDDDESDDIENYNGRNDHDESDHIEDLGYEGGHVYGEADLAPGRLDEHCRSLYELAENVDCIMCSFVVSKLVPACYPEVPTRTSTPEPRVHLGPSALVPW